LASGVVLYEPVAINKHAIGLDEPCDGVYGLTARAATW
jgi:hypothetical protein